MARRLLPLLFVALLVLPLAASADWDETIPAKWVQLPDETYFGIDVNASYDYILADDFECTETGAIRQIHIWGSWLGDLLPMGDPTAVSFILSIHEDIPAEISPTGYSMPGDVLWHMDFLPGEFTARIWLEGVEEGWMDPPEGYIWPADFTIWQYNFYVPVGEEFIQLGDPANPIVYWLDVKAIPVEETAYFGWKTSWEHWNDDAVWVEGFEPYFGDWYELRYPPGHEYFPNSIDLAFVIVGEEHEIDYGDAPDPPYPTWLASDGARHIIGGPWLGDLTDSPDPDPDGQPDPNALGDDNDGNDDEDGVVIPLLVQGTTSTITFEVSGGNGNVDGWIDFDGDGTWSPAELVVSGVYAPGVHAFNVTTPAFAVIGQTFARFRISTAGGLTCSGLAADGEVEDHEVWIEEGVTPFKWEQRPDLTPMGIDVNATEPYILADDYECTEPGRITEIHVWGSWLNDWYPFGVDPEAVDFILSFHEDIPAAESPTGYSMPGDVLWYRVFDRAEFEAVVWASDIEEGWMDPPDNYLFPADWTCWLYKFWVPVNEAFFQSGTVDNPIVYWLDVQAIPHDPDAWFGWKTSIEQWNDDAVWVTGFEPYFGDWYELRYPPGHPYFPESLDLAFRLANEPSSGVPREDAVPEGFGLYQNVPNPFTSATTIRYNLPAGGGRVRLQIYDVAGRLVRTLVNEMQQGGEHNLEWSGRNDAGHRLPAGIYFQRLMLDNQEISQKMLLAR